MGDGINILVEDEGVLERRFVRGESRIGHDDVADLDILVHFRLLGDLSSPPYIDGQVYAFDTVDQKILYRVGHAFNAGLEVYTPEEIEQVSNSELVQRQEEGDS